MQIGTPEMPDRGRGNSGSMRGWLAGGAALALVMAFAGVAFALHGGIGQAAAGVTASTPPDAAQVTVTERKGVVVQGGQVHVVPNPAPVVVYQHTFSDAATVRQIQGWLNEPADAHQALPDCTANAPNANTMDGAAYTYSTTFTAHGVTIERVDVLMRCFGVSIQRGYAPSLILSGEVGAGPNAARISLLTYLPTDLEPRSAPPPHP